MPKATKKTKVTKPAENVFTVAKTGDGTIQINFVIPYSQIELARTTALNELAKDVEVKGFRKGKAPVSEVAKNVSAERLTQNTLSHILPKLLGEAITKEKLRLAIYPKFELIKANPDEAWEVRAITCELPKVDLTGYKDRIKGSFKASEIWTPEKGDVTKEAQKEEASAMQKEQVAIDTLLKEIKVEVPKILTEEETNSKLSQLLERIEKLGLDLDSYLRSVGKTPQSIRAEYEIEANRAISLDLILNAIAEDEKIVVNQAQIDASLQITSNSNKAEDERELPERKRLVESILRRREALNAVVRMMA